MNNKKTIILLVISIVIVIAATAGVTFAYLSVNAVQTNSNVIETSCYSLNFTDSNSINLTGYPMSNASAFSKLTPYHFTLSNACESTTDYQVIINVLNTSSSTLLPYINYSIDGVTVNKLTSLKTATLPSGVASTGISTSYVLDTGSIVGTTSSKTYDLYLWIDETAGNDIMGQTFSAQVMVYGVAK